MAYLYLILPSIYIPGEKQESSKLAKTKNWRLGSHGYVRGLRLESQGQLLQNVEFKYKEDFWDVWYSVSQVDVLWNSYKGIT